MKTIPNEILDEWAGKICHIEGRLNRIRKKLKKLNKQEKHFEMRLRLAKEYKKKKVTDGSGDTNSSS